MHRADMQIPSSEDSISSSSDSILSSSEELCATPQQLLPKQIESNHISFLSFNPDLLDDEEFWPISCLEGLCCKLGLSSHGNRDELVNRLRVWHVQKFKSSGLHGGNFHLLPVKEKSVPSTFLSPFRPASASKPILRKRSRYSFNSSGVSSPASVHRRSSSVVRTKKRPNNKKKSVQFSPYNKVHLLSPRRRPSAPLLSDEDEEEEEGRARRALDFNQYD